MVHISEVANTFVNEIKDHLTEGQSVKVKVLSVSEEGKISLSIKKAVDNPPQRKEFNNNGKKPYNNNGGKRQENPKQQEKAPLSPEAAFEDMLNKFKMNSEERMSDIKKNVDNKRRSQSRRK